MIPCLMGTPVENLQECQHTCLRRGTLNAAYDLKCQKCGEDPGCADVAEHGQVSRGT